MEIRCMGTTKKPCGAFLGVKEPLEDNSVSHGLCLACSIETEIINQEEIEKINSFNRKGLNDEKIF